MKPCLRVTLWYLLFGALWISLTDRLLGPLSANNAAVITGWQTIKGWLYVAGSGCLIFFLTRHATRLQERAEQKRLETLKLAVRKSHHILLNYFNQMQLMILEAERSSDFDKNLIEVAREATDKAEVEVRQLEGGTGDPSRGGADRTGTPAG